MHFQCPRPKLTQLQARCAASLSASLFILAIYLFVTSPKLAYAQEIPDSDSPTAAHGADHNWFRILDYDWLRLPWVGKKETGSQEKVDDETARSVLRDQLGLDPFKDESPEPPTRVQGKRQASATVTLPGNNTPVMHTIGPNELAEFVFIGADVFGPTGEPGKGLPGGFQAFENVGGDLVDYYEEYGPEIPYETGYNDAEYGNEYRKRDAVENRTVYITINTCTQPTSDGLNGYPDSLTLYASATTPGVGPDNVDYVDPYSSLDVSDQVPAAISWSMPLVEGWAGGWINATGTVYIGVYANNTPPGFTGSWSFQLAASIDTYYHNVDGTSISPLYLVDTDSDSALLITDNVTQAYPNTTVYEEWMDIDPVPFIIYVQPAVDVRPLIGMRQSTCALQTAAQIVANAEDATNPLAPVQMSMTTRGLGAKPKEQFYVRGLNASTGYQAYLAMKGNGTASGPGVPGGGGFVWPQTSFTTKTDGNCALMFGLDFCSEVAYAVPANPFTYPNASGLANFYDSYAQQLWANFSYTLQLIPCDAPPESQYSLSQNCASCAAAYKAWLCAVTIPRCADFGTPGLQPRNMGQNFINGTSLSEWQLNDPYNPMPSAPFGSMANQQTFLSAIASNSSRNPNIDSAVKPGPYAELLPCEDLCWDLVRNCHAALGFVCPYPGRGLEIDYAPRRDTQGVSCNYAGATYFLGAATRGSAPAGLVVVLVAALVVVLIA